MNAPLRCPRATFVGHGERNAMVCIPSDFSQQQAVEFAKENDQKGRQWRVVSSYRVPCDCRNGFAHMELEAA